MINLVELYAILRLVALHHDIISYRELSVRYLQRTEEQHHWHGTWDAPLGQLNGHTQANGLPAISAVVTYQIDEDDPDSQFGPPGNEFWGSPGVPARPATAQQRELVWMGIVGQVHQANWPEHLRGLV